MSTLNNSLIFNLRNSEIKTKLFFLLTHKLSFSVFFVSDELCFRCLFNSGRLNSNQFFLTNRLWNELAMFESPLLFLFLIKLNFGIVVHLRN